ncbi:MAG: SusE domain-containing protein, partial [Lutibacter sp.]
MKIILNKILLLIVAATFLASCDKEELTVLNSDATTVVSLSKSDVVLAKSDAGQDALTVSWTDPDFGFDAGAEYKIVFTAGEKSETVAAGTNLSKVFETVQLNKVLLKLGLKGGTPTEVSVQIQVVLSIYHSLSSNSTSFSATAYEDKLDLSTIWGVVGSATVNGWDGPDMPF